MSEEAELSEHYFLSYSRADELIALRFATDLRGHGVAMWVDQLDIRPSEHWDRAIERAVGNCRGLVVILSPRSVASDNVADEISFAIDSGKSVLPVMIERCTLPLRITRMQVINATADYDKALQQCLQALGSESGLPVRKASPPAAPRGVSDVEAIAKAKAMLTGSLGPIAAILVDKAAARASSVSELCGLLAEHVRDNSERERLMGLAGLSAPPGAAPARLSPASPAVERSTIGKAEVERLASTLCHFLGPVAAVIVRRESAAAMSTDDLRQRLSGFIRDEVDRAEFLRQVQLP